MSRERITEVLANWLREARASGELVGELDEAAFAAERFVAWWRSQVEDSLGQAEWFAQELASELRRVRVPAELEDMTHLLDALAELRADLGFEPPDDPEADAR